MTKFTEKPKTINYFESNPDEKESKEKREEDKEEKQKNKVEEEKESLMKQSIETQTKLRNEKHENATEKNNWKKNDVNISQSIEPIEKTENGSFDEDQGIMKSRRLRKSLIYGSAGLGLLIVFAVALVGIELFDRYLRTVPMKEILKGDVDLALRLNTNADFEQYKLLDGHLKKFPGYDILAKELDETGEGKTPSQFIQDKMRENNLSFQDDIQPVLGDDLFIVVPDLKTLEQNVQERFSLLRDTVIASLNSGLEIHRVDRGLVAQTEFSSDEKVLGMTTDYYALSNEVPKMEPLDFIAGAEIRDLKEAKRVLEKIKNDKQRYEVKEKKHESYTYFSIKNLKCDAEEEGTVVDISVTHHVLLGGNWIMSTSENDLKEMISQRKKAHFLSIAKGPLRKGVSEMSTLAQSSNFSNVENNIFDGSEKAVLFGYFDVDFGNFFGGLGDHDQDPYFKYPESLIGGFAFKVEQDGIVFRSISNQVSLDGATNAPFSEGIARKIPSMVDGRFTDVFVETEGVKKLYYSFKKNNLTKNGLEEWDEARRGLNEAVGVDFERDIIDQIDGNVALALFAKRGLEPEEAIIAQIKDKERIVDSAKKMIELAKLTYIGMFSMGSEYHEDIGISGDADARLNQVSAPKTDELTKSVMDSQLRETQTDNGTIYSYNLPGTPFSFDFAFFENNLILGSHYTAVQGLLAEFKTDSGKKLASEDNYQKVSKYVFPSGYSKMYLNTFGVWNSFEYYLDRFRPMETQEDKDLLFLIGSFVRTINTIAAVDAISSDNKSAKSSIYLNIKELPQAEKQKAKKIIETTL